MFAEYGLNEPRRSEVHEGRRKKEEGRANKISVNIVIISNSETLLMIFISDTNELTTY
ncbi:hypothetical protein MEO93_08310 [Dolichospermum sp. ST_sed3]|nr:hypothetical protein [Dolichospermum sp. ST_sed3]MDD1456345.1 hypothetical protein [Dolichospermum sp. ST_sed7]MDD1461855.1 hypothetical protein [Dolichospermum sp. ST_sed2]MDD1472245.1 hypothetical protein [Dolichospermum sp. ST_sed4]